MAAAWWQDDDCTLLGASYAGDPRAVSPLDPAWHNREEGGPHVQPGDNHEACGPGDGSNPTEGDNCEAHDGPGDGSDSEGVPPVPPGDNCEVCGSGDGANSMLICDGCREGTHMSCLSPPMQDIPAGDWFCAKCEQRGGSCVVLTEDVAVRVACAWYDTESVFASQYKMKPVRAFRNDARVWSIRYRTIPSTGGPHFVRVEYEMHWDGATWVWKASLFTLKGASKLPSNTIAPQDAPGLPEHGHPGWLPAVGEHVLAIWNDGFPYEATVKEVTRESGLITTIMVDWADGVRSRFSVSFA